MDYLFSNKNKALSLHGPKKKNVKKMGIIIITIIILVAVVVFMLFLILKVQQIHNRHSEQVRALVTSENWRHLHHPSGSHYPHSQHCLLRGDFEKNNSQNFHPKKTPSNFAFVFGGLGGYAKLESFKCLLALESLIKVGGYEGDVYFITEKESCVPTQQELRRKFQYNNLHVIYKEDYKDMIPPHYEGKKIPRYLQDMSIKQDLFHYLPKKIQVAAWYDCDVVFGVKDCIKRNLLCALPKLNDELVIFNSAGWHMGSFMVHRDYSKKLLKDWKEELFKENYASDYLALKALFERQQKQNSEFKWKIGRYTTEKTGNSYSSDHAVLRSDPSVGEKFSSWRDVLWDKNTPNSCVMHLTTGRCSESNNGHAATDALINSLGLSAADKKYCPGTPRKVILINGLSRMLKSCKNLPLDFIFPLRSKCILCAK